LGFGDDPVGCGGTGLAADRGDDAEGAAVVAAVLNLEVGTGTVSGGTLDGGLEEFVLIEDVADVDFGVVGGGVAGDDVANEAFVGVADDPGNALDLGKLFGGTLCITASDENAGRGVVALNTADDLADVLVGGGGDGTGVEDDEGRVIRAGSRGKAFAGEAGFKGGAVGLGGAATEILDEKAAQSTPSLSSGVLQKAEGNGDERRYVDACIDAE
jgi:hypothetical protein